ncbi:O-acetyl-ADP-ribose deacetylase (regulator of RNase III), contains Macro domain [Chryseobacterium taichungense]|uniref:O-acetyl-ADP-ribose deacetylase (Regulator of RNase III), contains Macro domain n=1 Tax=Chryseobacterium taichungense TaxID=295069 RepID=A0A1H8BG46_9FLAO|nr:macro domain-containing protein [Chryseobacterium taichungense]SEM81813.1 O-acetyl-ADP-ribose deacetylase (regulator of RNase III), contains Macro domain [Chryseobacterium taichungense]
MIQYKIGNLLDSNAKALVNTVNTDGVMGKGIALQFKNQFPNNYKEYVKACKNNEIGIGKLFVFEENTLLKGKKIIINFPTKTSWRKPSEYSYIEKGLIDLIKIINDKEIKSIAIPPLGAGNGGLDWNKVKKILEEYLENIDCEVQIYEPNSKIIEVLRKERTSLTPARAMLLYVLFDLVKNGEFLSEFSAEKVAYFLQKFGARDILKLDYKKNFYGPYSGKIKHVLYHLNGSYITGYSSKDKKPFEELGLILDAEKDIIKYLNRDENLAYKDIADKTKSFLSGFYSNFALELLSTVDYIKEKEKVNNVEAIIHKMEQWNNRKITLFAKKPHFIEIALNNINNSLYT